MFPDVHTNKLLADIVKTDWGREGALQIVPKLPPGPKITEKKTFCFKLRYFWNQVTKPPEVGLNFKDFNISQFLSDPGPVIVYACHSLTH